MVALGPDSERSRPGLSSGTSHWPLVAAPLIVLARLTSAASRRSAFLRAFSQPAALRISRARSPIAAGPPPADPGCPQYPLGLDLGEVARGHRLIAESFCLHDDCLTLFYFFTGPAPAEPFDPAGLHLDAWYDADISISRLTIDLTSRTATAVLFR